jgi:Ca2+-binding RTX toxin-like protein
LEGANSQNLTLGLEASEAGILQVWATAGNSSTIDLGSMTNNVEIRTSAGDDLIYGGEGWDTVYSGTGNDTITGGTGVDSLMGEDGDDVFLIHNGKEHDAFYPKLTLAGRETIIGGNGSDEIRFTSTDAAGQLLTLSDDVDVEMARISDAAGDQTGTYNHSIDASRVIGNIELHGNNGHNTLTGNNADNIITGEDGDDTLIAADGNDSVMGGAGDDSITGGAGKDTLDGGDGADTFVVEHWADITSADEVIGGDNVGGVDTLVLKDAGLYDFRDAAGDLKLDGVEVISLDANNGVSTVPFQWEIYLDDNAVNNATDQTVTITANVAQTGKVIVVASDILSSDAAIVVKGTNMNGNDYFNGGAGDDTLNGGDGGDQIVGNSGDDVISGDGGADDLNGNDGDDIFIFTDAEFGADLTVDGGNDTDTLRITDDANLKDGDFKPVHDLEKLELKGLGVQTVELGVQAGAGFNDVTVLIDSKAAGLNLDASSIGASDKVAVTATINADTLIGGAGDDSLDAGEGHDALTGGAGQDSLTGGAGDDAFIFVNADFGSDSRVDGGDGDDTIRITDDATVNDAVNDADFTTVRSVKTLKLEGSGAQNVRLISGSAADDAGLLKIDARDGGASTIDISGTRNHIWVSTEKGNDTITGGSGDNTLVAGDGNDSIDGNDGRDDLIGQDGNDTLRGGNDADILAGVDGNDLLDGGAGDDTLFGGAGNDTLIAGSGNDRIGTDGAGKGDEFGDDVIRFNSADFDWQDTIDGGSDDFSDTNTLEIADDATIIDGDFKNVRDVQKLLLSGTGAQKVTLDQEADKAGLRAIDAIHGNKSDIDIAGTQNNIAVETGAGDDTIMGGTGNNFIVSGADNDSIEGGEGGDTINGGSGKDTLVGNAGADTLIGDAGDDTFVYVSASELEANESIDGGSDTDMIRLDAGGEYRFDKANVSNIERVGINANAAFNLTLGDNFNIDGGTVVIGNLSGAAITQNLVIDASGFVGDSLNVFARNFDGDDTIIGGNSADTINSGAGEDIITGGAGDDSLAGGDGYDVFLIGSASDHGANEILSGGNDIDVIRFTTTQNGDILILGSTVTDIEAVQISDEKGDASGTTSAKIDASSVTGAIDLYGNAGDNMFRGNAAANVITGGQGDDWISTGAGADRVIHKVGDGTDTLADFDATQDKFDTRFVSSADNYNFRTYTPVQTSNYRLAPLTLATDGAMVEGVIEFQDNFDNNSIDFTKIEDVIGAISNGNLSVSSAGGKTLLLLNDLDGGAMSLGASTPDVVDSYLYEVNDLNSNSVVSADEITLVGVFNNVGGTGSGALSVGDIV